MLDLSSETRKEEGEWDVWVPAGPGSVPWARLCHGGKTTLLFHGLTEEGVKLLLGSDFQHSLT